MEAANTLGQAIIERPPARPRADRSSIQSVDRALTILNAIAESGGETTLTEVSGRIGLNISTCHHLLATLMKWGYVAKAPGKRSYMLGARTVQLGLACLRQVDLPRRAQPYVERISAATGETVHLAVLQGDHLVTLLKREARHAVRVDTGAVGQSDAVHATATGKAMLAWLPEDEIRRLVTVQGMIRFTPTTITEFPALIEELRLVRRNGFALDREEFLPGVICVGAAVRDHAGAVVGAISASTPTMRASDEHIARMREEVVAATRALSVELGAQITQAAALDQTSVTVA
ncbi:MAG: IclR family transcriptional regulator [Rhizobiales bacterium]|nr:IclR family transcriptional regulator [Hyphomicrobiales bacterium]